jgi:hypothetical protein
MLRTSFLCSISLIRVIPEQYLWPQSRDIIFPSCCIMNRAGMAANGKRGACTRKRQHDSAVNAPVPYSP